MLRSVLLFEQSASVISVTCFTFVSPKAPLQNSVPLHVRCITKAANKVLEKLYIDTLKN